MNIKYRMLGQHDIDSIYSIEVQCFTVPWSYDGLKKDLVENPCAIYIGAFERYELVGYAGMWVILDEAHITNIAVLPEMRGQGIGRRLLNGLLRIARRAGAEGITLEVRPSNSVALALYESMGFKKAGVRKKYYSDNGEDAYIMWLKPITFI